MIWRHYSGAHTKHTKTFEPSQKFLDKTYKRVFTSERGRAWAKCIGRCSASANATGRCSANVLLYWSGVSQIDLSFASVDLPLVCCCAKRHYATVISTCIASHPKLQVGLFTTRVLASTPTDRIGRREASADAIDRRSVTLPCACIIAKVLTYLCTYTRTDARIHACIHARMHARTQIRTHVCTNAHTCAHLEVHGSY